MRTWVTTAIVAVALMFAAGAEAAPSRRVVQALHEVFGYGRGFRTAECVSEYESTWNVLAVSPTGDYGLLQVHYLTWRGRVLSFRTRTRHVWIRLPYRLADFRKRLFDPVTNARVAWVISHGGTNWRPWSSYTVHGYCHHA